MASDDVAVASAEPVAELRRGALDPWVVLGSVLFVLAFVLGWRAAGGKQPAREATPTRDLPA